MVRSSRPSPDLPNGFVLYFTFAAWRPGVKNAPNDIGFELSTPDNSRESLAPDRPHRLAFLQASWPEMGSNCRNGGAIGFELSGDCPDCLDPPRPAKWVRFVFTFAALRLGVKNAPNRYPPAKPRPIGFVLWTRPVEGSGRIGFDL